MTVKQKITLSFPSEQNGSHSFQLADARKITSVFGEVFFLLRIKRDLSQEVVAARLGKLLKGKPQLSQSYISKIENGSKKLGWERFWLYCYVLEFHPSDVIYFAMDLARRNQKLGKKNSKGVKQNRDKRKYVVAGNEG